MEMFQIIILVLLGTWSYAFVQTHLNVPLKLVTFIIYESLFSNADSKLYSSKTVEKNIVKYQLATQSYKE